MDVYSYRLDGGHGGHDLQEINSLNHYIGMQPIERGSFADLDWLPFALGLLGLLTLRAAVIGSVRNLVDLLVITSYVTAFAFARFVYQLYVFGHELDPRAAVTIAPFMPVVLGTKQVANFTTHSFPHWGTLFMGIFAIGRAASVGGVSGSVGHAPGASVVLRGRADVVHAGRRTIAGTTSDSGASVPAAGGDGEGSADLAHFRGPHLAEPTDQSRLLDRLHVIEVDSRRVFQSFIHPDDHFARRAADGRRDGRHHHRVQQADDLLAREDEHRAPLVRGAEPVAPDLAAGYDSGHTPSPDQPSYSDPSPRSLPYARR
jgi:hypothetical protein